MNYSLRFSSLLLFVLLFKVSSVLGQDAHYYSQQPDSKGTLMGGTGTAGSRELSAVFYNPGIIALFEQSNVGLSGSLYTYDYVKISDSKIAQRGVNGANLVVSPSILAGTFKWKKNSRFTTSYAYLNTGFYSNRLSSEYSENKLIGGKMYSALNRYDIRTHYSEDWIGSGISYRINEHWGIGVIPYAHFYSFQFMQRSYTDYSEVDNQGQIEGSTEDFREARLFSPAFIFNVGVVYTKNKNEFGLTILTPRINITNFAFSSIERRNLSYEPGDDFSRSVLIDPDFLAKMKRPLEVNFGYAYLEERYAFKVRVTYYSQIKNYQMGIESDESIRSGLFLQKNQFDFLPVSSNLAVLNFGLGYEWRKSEKLKFIAGFRTDFSYFNNNEFLYFDFTTSVVRWHLYHTSFGVDWKYKRLQLNTGVDYSFSYQKNFSQFVDVNDLALPIEERKLAPTSNVVYQQIKLFMGLVLSFNANSK